MEIEKATERVDFYKQLVDQLVGFVPDSAVVASVVEQVGKDLRMSELLRRERKPSTGANGRNASNGDLATQSQRDYLRDLGVKKIPRNLSKIEASGMIDEALEAQALAAA